VERDEIRWNTTQFVQLALRNIEPGGRFTVRELGNKPINSNEAPLRLKVSSANMRPVIRQMNCVKAVESEGPGKPTTYMRVEGELPARPGVCDSCHYNPETEGGGRIECALLRLAREEG